MNTKQAASPKASDVAPPKKVKNPPNLTYLHPEIKIISLDLIKRNPKTQQRLGLNEETVSDYQEAIALGAKFPPIKLKYDGKNYWLWDGFHTVQAYHKLKKKEIEAEVTPGDLRDAILASVGANAQHGLRRNAEDKRKAIRTLLENEEWMDWSNRKIAKQCHVSESLVRKVKKEIGWSPGKKVAYEDKYGNQSEMKRSNTNNDDTITTAFKRSDVTTDDNNNTSIIGEKVEIVGHWQTGETGVITSQPNAQSAVVDLGNGKRDIFNLDDLKLKNSPKNAIALLDSANSRFDGSEPVLEHINKSLIEIGDLVLIQPSQRIDERLIGYKSKHARVINLYNCSADIEVWGRKISGVSLNDLKPIKDEFISEGISIKLQDYCELMEAFPNLEAAIEYALQAKQVQKQIQK